MFVWLVCTYLVLISYHLFLFVLLNYTHLVFSSGGSGNPKENKPKAFTDKAKVEVKRLQKIAKSISALL